MQSPLVCARGCRAMFAACQGRVRAAGPHAAPGFRVVTRWGVGWANCGIGADLEEGVEATLDSFHRNKTGSFFRGVSSWALSHSARAARMFYK
eukprot:3558941-Prymnesium_polylepis.1